jgi:LysR family transcriptional regulator, glycine cleavage system transcriptional activator
VVAPTHLKSLQALEDYLGFPLLLRGRSGLQPPPELQGAFSHLVTAFRALDAAVAQLDMQRRHEIQIAAVPDFADLWLAPRLRSFRQHNPHVRFCINGEGDAPLRHGQADCEISSGPAQEDERTDLLFRDYLLPVCSPATKRRIGKLRAKARLEGYPLLHLDFYRNDPQARNWPEWIAAQRLKRTAPNAASAFSASMAWMGRRAVPAAANPPPRYPSSGSSFGSWCAYQVARRCRMVFSATCSSGMGWIFLSCTKSR